jgi:hypothetical protein
MKEHNNDNDELPFVSIGLASALILNKLRLATQLSDSAKQKDEGREGDTNAGRGYQEKGAKYGSHIT